MTSCGTDHSNRSVKRRAFQLTCGYVEWRRTRVRPRLDGIGRRAGATPDRPAAPANAPSLRVAYKVEPQNESDPDRSATRSCPAALCRVDLWLFVSRESLLRAGCRKRGRVSSRPISHYEQGPERNRTRVQSEEISILERGQTTTRAF